MLKTFARWHKIGEILQNNSMTMSTAESCTGGMIGMQATEIPGSSKWYKGGIISYTDEIKQSLLNVPKIILKKHGAVSETTAKLMAEGVKEQLKTDYAISVTGIAGPGGATREKPVGLVYIGIATPEITIVKKHIFKGDRQSVREQATNKGSRYLLEELYKLNQ